MSTRAVLTYTVSVDDGMESTSRTDRMSAYTYSDVALAVAADESGKTDSVYYCRYYAVAS